MGDNYWELTIAQLQDPSNPLVDKPKLSEKYLTKPPFRFLHDVISAVQAKTGFAPGLLQGDELDGKALQDKDAKVVYLTKIINIIAFVLGEPVPAKPLKIVAGLEPENTNVFLQMLGKAAQKGDGAAFVPKVLAGEQPGAAPAEKPKAKPKPKPKPAEEAAPAPAAEEKPAAPAEKPKKTKPKAPAPEEAAPAPPPPAEEPPKEEKKKKPAAAKPKPKEEDAPLPAPAPEPVDPLNASTGSATAAAQKSLGRPQSARKAPPKLPAATPAPAPSLIAGAGAGAGAAAAPAASGARPGTASRRGPEPAAAKPIMLFEEGTKGDDDDDVEVVHEQRPVAVGAVPEGEQGVLVKNILEAEKALKKTRDEAEDEQAGSGIILKRLGKAPAATAGVKAGDHQGIREMVQKLTQSSHPLAKSMDYLQEDLENMAKEYRFWVTERRVFQEKLGDEQRMAQDQAAADARLADLEGQVRQVRDRTLGLKAQILRNDETIAKLLSMAVSGGR